MKAQTLYAHLRDGVDFRGLFKRVAEERGEPALSFYDVIMGSSVEPSHQTREASEISKEKMKQLGLSHIYWEQKPITTLHTSFSGGRESFDRGIFETNEAKVIFIDDCYIYEADVVLGRVRTLIADISGEEMEEIREAAKRINSSSYALKSRLRRNKQ